MDNQIIEDDIIDENPWSNDNSLEIDNILQDEINNGENIWMDETDTYNDDSVIPTVKSLELESGEEEEEDDDDFGSFEEQPMVQDDEPVVEEVIQLSGKPKFVKTISEIMDSIIPEQGNTTVNDDKIEFPQDIYRKITSPRREYNRGRVENSYTMMNYWSDKSATNAYSKEIIRHWGEQEQGFLSSLDDKQPTNSYKLFNWTTTSKIETQQQGKKLENKSHQDKLLNIVMDEALALIAKRKQKEMELKSRKQIKPKLTKPIMNPLQPHPIHELSGDKSPTKKKFSIGTFFNFNSKE